MLDQRRRDVLATAATFVASTGTRHLYGGKLVDGHGSGLHRSRRVGGGTDSAEARPYELGDDPRRIDWAATARTGTVQVRDTHADQDLRTVIVVDGSASMFFGTAGLLKYELGLAVAAVAAETAKRSGDSVGVLLAGDEHRWIPPGSGTEHTAVVLRTLAAHTRPNQPTPLDMTDTLRRTANLAGSRRGLVVVVTDLDRSATREPDQLVRALRRLTSRHRVVVVACRDRREDELVGVGIVDVEDPETGERFTVDTNSARVQQAWRTFNTERATQRRDLCRRGGADLVEVHCQHNWERQLPHVLDMLGGRR